MPKRINKEFIDLINTKKGFVSFKDKERRVILDEKFGMEKIEYINKCINLK
jgi:hypothetical protein